MKNVINRIALVTGAAGGIGSAICERFISDVDALVLVDIDQNKLDDLHKKLQSKSAIPVISQYCDVGDSNSVETMLVKVTEKVGTPNIIINNAGIGGPFHRVDEVSDDEWYKIINTNLKSIFNLSKFLLPSMKHQNYGRIVNIASAQGYLGAALSSTYVASKHGVIGYTRAIAAEWGKYGITCNAVCPGYVDTAQGVQDDKVTDHHKNIILKTPTGRIAKPQEIANIVLHLIKDESSFINGSILTIDGGLTCHVGVS